MSCYKMFLAQFWHGCSALVRKNKSLLERNFQSVCEYMISFYNKWIFHNFSANISEPLSILSHQRCQLSRFGLRKLFAVTIKTFIYKCRAPSLLRSWFLFNLSSTILVFLVLDPVPFSKFVSIPRQRLWIRKDKFII